MKILLDVDGVVSDFVGGLLSQLDDAGLAHGIDINALGPRHLFDYMTPGVDEIAHGMVTANGFATLLPVIAGAQEGVNNLIELGYKVVFVTAPWKPSRTWCADRYDWLRANFPHECDVIFTSAKEHVLGDVLIDDYVPYITKWNLAHPSKRAFVYDAPWNRNVDRSLMRVCWSSIPSLLGDGLGWDIT